MARHICSFKIYVVTAPRGYRKFNPPRSSRYETHILRGAGSRFFAHGLGLSSQRCDSRARQIRSLPHCSRERRSLTPRTNTTIQDWRGPDHRLPGSNLPAVIRVLAIDLLDAKELIIFSDQVGAAERAGFDLPGVGCDRYVCDGGVLRFTGTMADDDAVTVLLREFDGIERLGERADLVHFHENRIGRALLDSFAQEFHVGYEQIVADELDFVAELVGELLPVCPIAFRAAVLDADDGIAGAKFSIERHQLAAAQLAPGAFLEYVIAVAGVKLRTRHVQ